MNTSIFHMNELHESIEQWRKDAIADGWKAEPTYTTESIESSTSLFKDGFYALVVTRAPDSHRKYWNCRLNIWGPDGCAIEERFYFPYRMGKLQHGLTSCEVCHTTGNKTVKVGFANRCCEHCAPNLRKKIEVGRWAD